MKLDELAMTFVKHKLRKIPEHSRNLKSCTYNLVELDKMLQNEYLLANNQRRYSRERAPQRCKSQHSSKGPDGESSKLARSFSSVQARPGLRARGSCCLDAPSCRWRVLATGRTASTELRVCIMRWLNLAPALNLPSSQVKNR